MSNPISIESINAPFDLNKYQNEAEEQQGRGRTLVSLGVAVMVLNDADEMLVLHHEARQGQWRQGALGASMETLRYTRCTENGPNGPSESAMQAWQRSLNEELGMDEDDLANAGFYFARDSVVAENEWAYGQLNGYPDAYSDAVSMSLRVENPDVIFGAFTRMRGRSEEINRVSFISPDQALVEDNVRPGFKPWLLDMKEVIPSDEGTEPVIFVEPVARPPFYGDDIRFVE